VTGAGFSDGSETDPRLGTPIVNKLEDCRSLLRVTVVLPISF
jgi:hypothetical protein